MPELINSDISRLEVLPSHRQGRLLGPLLGFVLASLFPNFAIARLQPGSIKFQYDPIASLQINQPSPSVIYQTSLPVWEPITKPPEDFHLEIFDEDEHHIQGPIAYPNVVTTNLESPSEFLLPPPSQTHKKIVKRAISSRYLATFRRNRYGTRKRFPDYSEYDNYDYPTTSRLKNRRRNQGRRPVGFDYDYDYDYDYEKSPKRKQQRRKNNKNKNRRDPDFYGEEEYNDDIEPVTAVLRPRQRQTTTHPTTTTTETTTMPSTTLITNGTTPGTTTSTTTNATITTGYGYGPYSGNENVSITYGPPSAIKPIYGVPGTALGTPLNEWAPSYAYESPNSFYATSHHSPSLSYASPSSSYGAPSSSSSYSPGASYGAPSVSYVKPYAHHGSSYGPPSTSYGVPNQSYGIPSQTYGTPSQSSSQSHISQGGRAANYPSYQLPFSSWYGRSASHSDIVKRAQDIVKYD